MSHALEFENSQMEVYEILFELIEPFSKFNNIIFRVFEIKNKMAGFKSQVAKCVLLGSHKESGDLVKLTFYILRHPTNKTSIFIVEQVHKNENVFNLNMHLENVSPLKNTRTIFQ